MNVPFPEISDKVEPPDMAAVAKELPKLEAISSELFDSVTVGHATDPETDFPTFVFTVTARGEPLELVERRREWHRRTQSVLKAACSRVQLMIDVVEDDR